MMYNCGCALLPLEHSDEYEWHPGNGPSASVPMIMTYFYQPPAKGYCTECCSYNGMHESACKSRGYANVGPHPDSPDAAAPVTERLPAGCTCGVKFTGGLHSSWCDSK
jgi:hypothetical protein